MTETAHQRVLIVDFGSQVTQLIARRLRESGVYCEIHRYDKVENILEAFAPKAVILSGGPASVHEAKSPAAPQKVFELGVPVLGICYGEMTMCAQLGGSVEGGKDREFGRAEITILRPSPLVEGPGRCGPPGNGLDEPWRQGHRRPAGFRVGRRLRGQPLRDDRRRGQPLLRHPVSPGGGPYP